METKTVQLKDCPASGTGVHVWIYYAACRLIEAGKSDDEIVEIIEPLMTRAPAPAGEIMDAIRSARREDKPKQQIWPKRNFLLINQIQKREPPNWQPINDLSAEMAVDLLFPGNPLLCIGQSSSVFATRRRETWRGRLARCSLIVPSPMIAREGKTKAGHMSEHSLDNTGDRHYLVIEFDWGSPEGQMKLLDYLSEWAPLVMVVHSGKKSFHGWMDVRGKDEEQIKKFFDLAVSVGADSHLWLKSQFCRLPGGTRDTGEPQRIYFCENDFLLKQRERYNK